MASNVKIIDRLFFLICFFLIFSNIPESLQINTIGSVLKDKLIFYPLALGGIYTIYLQYKYNNIFVNLNKFVLYFCIFLIVNLLSLIFGLINYSYYELILNGPVDQIEKLPKVLDILSQFHIQVDKQVILLSWMLIRTVKNLILESIYTFGGAYMIYCWYCFDWKRGMNILIRATICSVIVVCLYSIIEVFYLSGNLIATNILKIITPFFHVVLTDNGWWPPLLWNGQLRSIFAEPSYFGTYAAFAIPFLLYKIINDLSKWRCAYIAIFIFFTFCLFLTKARTGVVLFCGEIFLFIAYSFYLRDKQFFKQVLFVLFYASISFLGANFFINNIEGGIINNLPTGKDVSTHVSEYMKENVTSLASTNQRSNNARYSIMLADLKIGIDYPILGVGKNLRDAYVPDYLPPMAEGNKEIERWNLDMHKFGVLRFGFPRLSEYATRFAESGILGLLVFICVPLFLLKQLLMVLFNSSMINKEKMIYLFFTLSLIGILTAAIGGNINSRYCYWVLLGLGFAMCSKIKSN